MDVAQLAAAARDLGDAVGLELQWDLRDDPDSIHENAIWQLSLHVITARPGEHHSRYSTVELTRWDAEELAQREIAHRIAREVAAATGVPLLSAPPIEKHGGQGDSAWIRAQPAGPPYPYLMQWEARWYTDDGEPSEASGRERVAAISGYDAGLALSRELDKRYPARPLSVSIRGGGRESGGIQGAGWPDVLPSIDRVRDIALTEGCRASQIARGLVARVPTVTALDLMNGFEDAFHLAFERLRPLALWRRGELDDAGLDAALPQIAEHRFDWDRPRRLREAFAAGTSIAALVRDQRRQAGFVRIAVDLIDALGLELRYAKEIVDSCRDPRNDARLDALIREHHGERWR